MGDQVKLVIDEQILQNEKKLQIFKSDDLQAYHSAGLRNHCADLQQYKRIIQIIKSTTDKRINKCNSI